MTLRAKVAINYLRLTVRLDDASMRAFNAATKFKSGMAYRVSLAGTTMRLDRCSTGCTAQFAKDVDGFNHKFEEKVVSTVVHHSSRTLDARVEDSAIVVDLGPYHTWPWMRQSAHDSKPATRAHLRDRFISEYNARLGSTFFVSVPQWAMYLVTDDEATRIIGGLPL